MKFNGKEVDLKPLDLNDLIELEKRFGDLNAIKVGGKLSYEQMRVLVWIQVRKSDPGLTEKKVGELLIPTDESFSDIISAVNSSLVADKK